MHVKVIKIYGITMYSELSFLLYGVVYRLRGVTIQSNIPSDLCSTNKFGLYVIGQVLVW